MKVLVVEDEEVLREELVYRLQRWKHEVQSAENGVDAWDQFTLDPDSFEVVLSDIRMPAMNGMELLQKLRKEEQSVPFIFMTGHGDVEHTIEALKLGAFDFILKPFEFEQLKASLNRLSVIRKNHQKQESIQPFIVKNLSIQLPSITRYIEPTVVLVQQELQNYSFGTTEVQRIGLCMLETLSNAIIHGNFEIASKLREDDLDRYQALIQERNNDPLYAQKKVVIEYQVNSEGFILTIQDEGEGFDWRAHQLDKDPLSLLEHGRGLFLVSSIMDEISWNERGNQVTLKKYAPKPESHE